MSILIETSLGELVIDLYTDKCPLAAKNFLKLCKVKYYNNVLIYNVQQNFMIQTGDPTGTGRGGTSVYGMLYGEQAKCFDDEIRQELKHDRPGLVCMASGGENQNTSQFYITMRGDDLEFLDGKHTIFGEVAEGLDTVLKEINELYCDSNGRPYRDVRILHTYVLEDPFDDPPGLAEMIPDASPIADRPAEEMVKPRLIGLEDEEDGLTAEELEDRIRETEAKKRAVVLEMIGDIPDAEIKPPDNVLFVCKLNQITTDEDLEIIFTRFGNVKAEIIRDPVTGDSLNYAFVEFEDTESCEEAYKKMNNALIDDRRIKVDFSQSVAKIWNKYTMRSRGTKIKSRGPGGSGGGGGGDPSINPLSSSAGRGRVNRGGDRGGGGGGSSRNGHGHRDGGSHRREGHGSGSRRERSRSRDRGRQDRDRDRGGKRDERGSKRRNSRSKSRDRGEERRRRRSSRSRSRERERRR